MSRGARDYDDAYMRHTLALMVLGGTLATAAGCAGPAAAGPGAGHRSPPVRYYLALGDSLARGVQPNPAGVSLPTGHGYADQLYALLRRYQPGLRLVKLGCPGETTHTMIHGGICAYPGGSQLAAAIRFLRANRSRMSLVTLDIGANDPDSCLTRSGLAPIAECVGTSLTQTAANLTEIMTRIRATDARVRIIAMNYYLPELARWRDGMVGRAFARVSELAVVGYNALLTSIYRKFGARVADVFAAFRTGDFDHQVTVPGFGTLPSNVAAICRWTWECAAPPRGPNEHANQSGYAVIARAFLAADGR